MLGLRTGTVSATLAAAHRTLRGASSPWRMSTPPLGTRARSIHVTANGIRQHCLDYGGEARRS